MSHPKRTKTRRIPPPPPATAEDRARRATSTREREAGNYVAGVDGTEVIHTGSAEAPDASETPRDSDRRVR